MSCTVCHIEYKTEDLAASQRFCEQTFGWEFRSFGDSMIVFGTPEGHIGGFVKGERPGRAAPDVCYKVEALDEFVANAKSHGATEGNPKHPVPAVGWYASIIAPDGNEFGLVEFTDQA
jgi:predicted enzyme related to lactoylglutathione lyase